MDRRERLLAAMAWEEPDLVPLTIYDFMVPRGAPERELRELGLCLIHREPAHVAVYREVSVSTCEYYQDDQRLLRCTIHTPVGEVSQVLSPGGAYDTTWCIEHYIKRPEDYKVIEFYFRDLVYLPNYVTIRQKQEELGGDGLVMVRVAKTPIQEMLYTYMGMERFAIDLYERPDLVQSLYEVMLKRHEELYELAVGAPAEIFQAADNMSSIVVGEERFRKYCLPEYDRHTRMFASAGKRLCVHMDGRTRRLRQAIAEANIQIIEGLTPPSVGNVSVAEAREAWPGKALWLNFTSSVHLESTEDIAAHTRQLIKEAGTKRGFAIGITEDVPLDQVARSVGTIARTIREVG